MTALWGSGCGGWGFKFNTKIFILILAHIAEIEVLEAAEPSGMEQDEYDHYLRITHAVRLVPVSPAVTASLPEGIFMFDFGKFLTVFVGHVENFNNFVLCDHSGKSLMFVF